MHKFFFASVSMLHVCGHLSLLSDLFSLENLSVKLMLCIWISVAFNLIVFLMIVNLTALLEYLI